MSASERRELQRRLLLLYVHLLKWVYQPAARKHGWSDTILEQRRAIRRLLNDRPSLEVRLSEFAARNYLTAHRLAAAETGLSAERLPTAVPWSVDDAMNRPLAEL